MKRQPYWRKIIRRSRHTGEKLYEEADKMEKKLYGEAKT